MAARPTRPKATRLYPSSQKTKILENGGEEEHSEEKTMNKKQIPKINGAIDIIPNKSEKRLKSSTSGKSGTTAAQHNATDVGKKSITVIKTALKEEKGDEKVTNKPLKTVVKAGVTSAKTNKSSSTLRSEKANTDKLLLKDTNQKQAKNISNGAITNNKENKVLETNASISKAKTPAHVGLIKPMHVLGITKPVPTNPQGSLQDRASKLQSESGRESVRERIVVPKATRLHDKRSTKKITKGPVMIMIMNVKGRDDKNGSVEERRRHIIQNIIQKYLPALVLFQDFQLPEISSKFWSKEPFPSSYVYYGNSTASIMFDRTVIDVQDVPMTEFKNTLDGLHRHSNNRLKRSAPTEFDPLPRMFARLVTTKQTPHVNFICISWHGKFNPNGDEGKMKHKQKLEYFEYLMEFLRIVKEKVKLPILIAGNFGVDMYSIEDLVHTPFQLCIYDASMRRTVPGIIDFFIITEELSLSEITWVSLREDTTAYQPNGVIDHDPVRAFISGKPSKGGGSKGMVNPKWQPSKPR